MLKHSTRKTVFFYNILIVILSIVSICSHLFLPLWKVDASYLLEEKTIESFLEDMLAENEDFKDINVANVVDEEGILLEVSISLQTLDVLQATKSSASDVAQNIIDSNINSAIDQFSVPLEKIAKNLVKEISKKSVQTAMKEQVSQIYGGEKTLEEIDQILENAGIDESYIEEKTETLVETIFSDTATVAQITNDTITIVEDVFDRLESSGEPAFKDVQLSEENKALIEETISDALSSIANEDGTIDITAFISQSIIDLLNDSENASEPDETTALQNLSASFEDSLIDESTDSAEETTEEDALEELKAMLREEIMERLPENIVDHIALALKFLAYFMLFTMCTWAYLLVKIIVKANMHNNTIKLKLPIVLGWLPFLILCAIPSLVFKALHTLLATQISTLNVQFYNGSWVALLVAIALCALYFVKYRKLGKELKSIKNGEIQKVDEENEKDLPEENEEDLPEEKTDKTPQTTDSDDNTSEQSQENEKTDEEKKDE